MILWFSGTGNSRYVAEKIAAATGDGLVSLNDKLKNNSTDKLSTNGRLVFVLPTYAWKIPRVIEELILKTELPVGDKVWFVMTCGSEIGDSAKYNRALCEQKGLLYMGTQEVVMPENYIAMFRAPDEKAAERIIGKAQDSINSVIDCIIKDKPVRERTVRIYEKLLSKPVNTLFYPMFVKSDKFYADDRCVGCGKCEQMCPLNNIKIRDGKPVWSKECTHCMACISYCPAEAIEYGKSSVGKRRYRCE